MKIDPDVWRNVAKLRSTINGIDSAISDVPRFLEWIFMQTST